MKLRHKIAAGALTAALALAGGLVTHWEGTRYTSYQDATGRWTICQGHTHNVHAGDTATPRQCQAWREEDLRIANAAITRCIHVPLTVDQHAALLDAVYNIGPSIVCGSTLQRKANAGQPFCHELLRWVYAGGKRIQGLVNRRQAEYQLCIGASK